jgi:hypothetical protein
MEGKHTAIHIYAICATNSLRYMQFRYMLVAQVCLPSRRWQIQDFSGMIVALILVAYLPGAGKFKIFQA